MKTKVAPSLLQHFSTIDDPRIERQKKHLLPNIFFITICAVICGADDWVTVEEFGNTNEKWFEEQLDLKYGIPSHDTFSRVYSLIETQQFSDCFSRWVSDIAQLSEGEVIAIDGKCLRGSIDRASNKAAIYMVSAWAQQNHLVLGQQKVDDKSNEITAIPKLLTQLDIKGAVVTLDAMGCQTKIAKQIVEQKADYVLSLKGNQGDLHDEVVTYFKSDLSPEIGNENYHGGHGRIETRAIRATADIQWLRDRHPNWASLKSIIAVTAKRELKNKTEEEMRYFISSLDATDPKKLGSIVRAHWSIENNLHWVLDHAFDEDSHRTRKGNSAANMAIIRHIALNLLKAEKSVKRGIKIKRLKAGWNKLYLLKVILGAKYQVVDC
jgi:predicted transposase YbfD/YdcC